MKLSAYSKVLLAFTLMLASGSPGQAEENGTYRLDEITVSARGVAAPVTRTPGGVGIVDSRELREQGGAGVVETLERIPGVTRSEDSPWSADVVIRGMTRDSVVVLVDGLRVNMTTDLNGRFGLVPPGQIERIEVLKGPVSALYGTGSMGGVVNIITKTGSFTDTPQWHGEASVAGSTNPAGTCLSASLGHATNSTWITGAVTSRQNSDYRDGDGDTVGNSQFKDLSAMLSGGLQWNDQHRTRVDAAISEATDVGIPGTGTAPLPVGADVTLVHNRSKRLSLEHTWTPEDSLLQSSSLRLGYQLIERNPRIDSFPSGPVARIEPEADHETLSAEWRNRLQLGNHALTAGLDVWSWHMTSGRTRTLKSGTILTDTPTPNTTQRSAGLYLEDDWTLARDWMLNIGARVDQIAINNDATTTIGDGSRDDTSWSGHLGLTWLVAEDWSLTALAASAYRTPNILEMFKNINLGGGISEIGNPDLDPERSVFGELGAHYAGQTLAVDVSTYANFVDDLIVSAPVSATVYRMDNVAKAEIYGAELAADWEFTPGWKLFGNAAYVRGRDVSAGEPLRFIPPLTGLLGVRQTLANGLWWSVETRCTAGQHETPEDVDASSFYALVNARGGYSFIWAGLQHELGLTVNNLLDRHYASYLATSRGVTLYEPGLNAIGSWTVHF